MQWQNVGDQVPTRGNRLSMWFGRSLLKAMRWQVVGEFPNQSKIIVAVAPHTSNMDFMIAMAFVLGLRLRASYLAKHTLFRWPLGPLMVALGGIPVNRDAPHGVVGQMVDRFDASSHLIVGITPEGTRSKVKQWKRGFALIAQGANVPILPAIVDTKSRVVRLEALITDVGDVERVIATVQELAGKRP